MLILLLPLDMLVSIYMHIISATLIFGANVLSQSYVQEEIDIIHDDISGRGGLYDSHSEFMKEHLYENKNSGNLNEMVNHNKPDSQDEYMKSDTYLYLQSLPFEIASLLKLSPLIKRQVNQLRKSINLDR